MSKAGIQSNRGDGFQTLVAFDWALTVLSDPSYEWLEIDSVRWPVDDVVIGKDDGRIICCQCKKNQTQHSSWTFGDLEDELRKAIALFKIHEWSEAWFYSRTAFGELAALREFSKSFADESSYQSGLTGKNKKTDSRLIYLLAEEKSNLSSYQFIQRIVFENSPEIERMTDLIKERLRQVASNHSEAFDAIWRRLSNLAMRVSESGVIADIQHRLNKEELKLLLARSGSVLTPPLATEEIIAAFQSTSAVGRAWKTDIAQQHLSNPAVDQLIEAIETKPKSVLLTGMPGSGKTCAMLEVQNQLERISKSRRDFVPLFIQSREFADITNEEDRASHGLSGNLVNSVARLSDTTHVVVMIDSLDVLSIAREHTVLAFFLSLIDRLLIIPNVSVITACRDFDRHYDSRIAQRSWEVEITCQPFDWESQVSPLLSDLGIDASEVDQTTRNLVCNPRELALFVDLALRNGSFSVVTSQALAEKYLSVFVEQSDALGDAALRAIEEMASGMLKLRTLALPPQQFGASSDVKRSLLSNNVLHEQQDGQLTFGHQTLLDVLVIGNAIRRGLTLNDFIQGLPAVPFVRPSIRSFVTQLASKDRAVFRKQVRTVLFGDAAFHIRRLVVETFSECAPHDEDWPLVRDLRSQRADIFHVLYNQANGAEWHYFWLKHLVPLLKSLNDYDGLIAHGHRISQWKNHDAPGVIAFWSELLEMEGVDTERQVMSIGHQITRFEDENIALCGPLLIKLLEKPRQEHSFLGDALARLVGLGGVDDSHLWEYIVGEMNDEDVLHFRFNGKLRCSATEFGNKNTGFLKDRMGACTSLLDMAITSVESWSKAKVQRYTITYDAFSFGFLNETSYADSHSQQDFRHVDDERFLFDAIQSGILHQARMQSSWWAENRERLAFNLEGSLRYFSILACIETASNNLDLIVRMLSQREWFEPILEYEIGSLLEAAFPNLDGHAQEQIQSTILSFSEEAAMEHQEQESRLLAQARLILAVPCHLRSTEAQAVIDECERFFWPLERTPRIGPRGGVVRAPFSFDVFLGASDSAVLQLLAHYEGHESGFDDFLIGGERQVGWQLREAVSRHPSRFVEFFSKHWTSIPCCFKDDVMEGLGTYLLYEHGDLRPNGDWSLLEAPDALVVAEKIIFELEKHPEHWRHNRAAAKAIEGCAFVVCGTSGSNRLVNLAVGFADFEAESSAAEDHADLLTDGINSSPGYIANALMVLAAQHEEKGLCRPTNLLDSLRQFSDIKNPATRSVLLRRMPYLLHLNPDIGWELFGTIMEKPARGLWRIAEPCLYHTYHRSFEKVEGWLDKLRRGGIGKDLETWGRISALAAFSYSERFPQLMTELELLRSDDAWSGAASVWSHPDNFARNREQCSTGLNTGMEQDGHCAVIVASEFRSLLQENDPIAIVPIDQLKICLLLLETKSESGRKDVVGIDKWLGATSLINPIYALEASELYFDFVRRTKAHLYDHEDCLTRLLTRLFAHAEELEESDGGEILHRVISVQDSLLALGVNGVDDWLRAAERSMAQ
jgi:hypothetical protein